jgi:7-cyano-7-deazaguanine synthase in queuosine biosynthesis
MRNILLYSGGLDSTRRLWLLGQTSTKDNPVLAISLAEHHATDSHASIRSLDAV